MKILVTGSGGLVGSEVCEYFAKKGHQIFGIDNNQRKVFFGDQGDVSWNIKRLVSSIQNYRHYEIDIRDRARIDEVVKEIRPQVLVHAAAQPSHDRAAQIPFDDFETNALGTLNILEAIRQYASDCVFVHMSTNKVYGDLPNSIKLVELDTRWDYDDDNYINGIAENFSIDQSKHSLFGASKVAADIMVQEYGRYFQIPTVCLRGGCLTGPNHSGVALHGFLNYLVKSNIQQIPYTIYGYKGKQVRDNIHSYDIVRFIELFIENPKIASVYNLGGGKQNTCSILEAMSMVEAQTGIPYNYTYVDQAREGDHICYYSDLTKMKADYPSWDISISLEDIIKQIVASYGTRS